MDSLLGLRYEVEVRLLNWEKGNVLGLSETLRLS